MPELPEKLYYSIREVAEYSGVEPHVLRYWESEFPTLRPRRARSGTRTYRKRDIDEVLAIKRLLHEEGYRIAGARKLLREHRGRAPAATTGQMSLDFAGLAPAEKLSHVRQELAEIMKMLKELREGTGLE